MILLILLSLNPPIATADIETFICHGKEETYKCYKYDGRNPNMYDYRGPHDRASFGVHEFSDAGTRNPYAPEDSESGEVGDNDQDSGSTSPVFIPYSPIFFFSGYGGK